MKAGKIIILLNIFLLFCFESSSQKYEFEFPEDIIKNNTITNVIIKESHPNYTFYNGEGVFHSEYKFNKEGKTESKIYLSNCGNSKKIIQCLSKDSFEYDVGENVRKQFQFSPKKEIKFNPNKPYKSNKRLISKLKNCEWEKSEIIELIKYNENGDELYTSIISSYNQEELKIKEYYYEYHNDELSKKYIVDTNTGDKMIMDSIIINGNSKESFYLIENKIESKSIIKSAQNGSYERQVFLKEGEQYSLWRIYKYDKKDRITSEVQGDYLTEFSYNKLGLPKEIIEKKGDNMFVLRKLIFEYK